VWHRGCGLSFSLGQARLPSFAQRVDVLWPGQLPVPLARVYSRSYEAAAHCRTAEDVFGGETSAGCRWAGGPASLMQARLTFPVWAMALCVSSPNGGWGVPKRMAAGGALPDSTRPEPMGRVRLDCFGVIAD
jgi:hypothetical protein